MKLVRLALLLLLLPAAGALADRPRVEREFQKTLPLATGKRLRVEHSSGEVAVKTHPGSEVRIHAWIRVSASPQSTAQEFADAIQIEAEADSGGVSVRTRYPERRVIVNISYSVDYEIDMPAGALLDVRNRFGSVSAVGVKGGTSVENANGSVTLREGGGTQQVTSSFGSVTVTGAAGDLTVTNANGDVIVTGVDGAAELTTRFGKVVAKSVSGKVNVTGGNGDVTVTDSGTASITTSFGAIRFNNVKSMRCVGANGNVTGSKVAGAVSVRNSFGAVDLSDVGGRLEVHNANGNVKVRGVRGAAQLETSFGVIDAEGIGGDLTAENSNGGIGARSVEGSARVRTTFGAVNLSEISGAVDVDDSNGSIDVREPGRAGADCRPITLKTSFGTVKIALPESAGYDVDARTSFGSIQSDFSLSADRELSSSAMRGKIGDGRCKLVIANSNGGVQILRGGGRR